VLPARSSKRRSVSASPHWSSMLQTQENRMLDVHERDEMSCRKLCARHGKRMSTSVVTHSLVHAPQPGTSASRTKRSAACLACSLWPLSQ
jgi:hypothetical protein